MDRYFFKLLAIGFLAGFLVVSGTSVMAQGPELTEAESEALKELEQILGMDLSEADDEQIASAIAQAIAANPNNDTVIVAAAIKKNPSKAALITSSAVNSVPPDRQAAVTAAAVSSAPPDQRAAVTAAAVASAASEQKQNVEAAANSAPSAPAPPAPAPPSPPAPSAETSEATEPPSRDDDPASDVLPAS